MLLLVKVILTLWVSWARGQESACDPPRIANSHFIADRSKYELGHIITYSCKSGFFPSSRGNTTKCTDKGWDPPPSCTYKLCHFPEIKQGCLYTEDARRLSFPVSVGTWFHYTCDENYVTPSQGKWDRLTCTRDGWSPEVPCRRKCIFNDLENGHRPQYAQQYLQGASVNVHCYPGYMLQNKKTSMTCTENGWLPPPRCIRVELPCGPPPVVSNAVLPNRLNRYPHGGQYTYTCEPGFWIRGPASVECSGGNWSHPPECINLSCGSPPPVQNVFIPDQTPRYQHGDTGHYECRHPLGLFGNAEGACLSGKWTDPPDCEGKCGPPPAIDNGDITTFPSPVYAPGSSVEYECQAYYELEGNRKITCRDGEWSEPPKCLDPCVMSEEILKEHNIEFRWSKVKNLYMRRNDFIEFRCRHGYHKVSPASAFRVQCREGKLEFPTCA